MRNTHLTILFIFFSACVQLVFSCSAGQYDSAGSCYRCPRGYSCSGTGGPSKCAVGQFSDFGASSCTDCPAGFTCTNPAAIPVPCPFGKYTVGKAIACIDCPPGFYCPTPAQINACTRGANNNNYCLGTTYNQRICPAGYYCPTERSDPIQCPVGSYSAQGADTCILCPVGKFCASQSFLPQDCPTGYYSLGNVISCTACPADHYCTTTSSSPIACAYGYYAPSMSTTCTQCPAGYYCDRVTYPGKATRCSAGFYSDLGATMCKECPAGYECPDRKLVACSTGWYSVGGTNLCVKCPAGSACATTDSLPFVCITGTHSGYGATDCTKCAAGKMCPATNMNFEIPCPKGTYQNLEAQTTCVPCTGAGGCTSTGLSTVPTFCTHGQYFDGLKTCVNCPAGYYCPDPRTPTIKVCPVGYYSAAAQGKCSICQPGYYCAEGTVQTACSSGYYSTWGQMRCTKCPPGYACNSGIKTIVGVMKCPPGYTAAAGSTTCTICAKGKMCPFPEFGEISCPTGTYAPSNGMSFCQPCPHGSSCSDQTAAAVDCADGTYSFLFEGACVNCPNNHACKNGLKIDCPLNYYTTGSASECTPCDNGYTCMRGTKTACGTGEYAIPMTYLCRKCPAGYSCTTGSATICAAGTYAPNEGMTSCTSCPTGTYSPAGSTVCYTCPGGHACTSQLAPVKCLPGQYALPGSGACSAGISGFIYPPFTDEQLPAVQIAPKGMYSKQNGVQVEVYKCPPGKYGPKLGATDLTDCATCPEGFYCPEGTGDPMLYECPQGYYCPAGSNIPTACPSDTYGLVKGGININSCRPCPPGYACSGASGVPTACPMGFYCPNGAKQTCPDGYYSGSRTGLRTVDECVLCPAGFYCPAGTPNPIPAPKGYYNPYMGMSALNNMLKCPPSYPCPTTGLPIFKGPPCTLGHYCPAGTINPNDNPCPAGTYSNSYFAITPYDCLSCPRGYGCPAGTTQSQLTTLICDAGYYCPRGTTIKNQNPCPAGTFRATTGARRIEECVPCPHGKFCVAGTSTPADCPAGYYCPLGTTFSNQYPCKAGTYSAAATTGLKSQEECVQCEFGNYCTGNGATTATPCAAGTFNNFSKEASACDSCPAGYKCAANTINPTLCVEGEYSDTGASACTTCEVGYYCPEKGTTKSDKLALYVCPAGMYCYNSANGLAAYPNLDDNGCSIGKYCPAGTLTEQLCPAGTYNPVRGRGSVSDCLTTVAGFYTNAGASAYLPTPCTPGYFCLAGSSTPTQYACPPGTYRRLNNGAKPEECVTCPAGYYCLTATAIPADCPAGFYCPLGTSKPESCPEGTYSGSLNLFDSKSCTPCPAGKYCYQRNLTTPVNLCDAGFYCIKGSKRPEPQDSITGNLCPKGGYCPQGAATPSACPAGKFMVIEGASDVSQCVPCTPGYYCLGSNSATPTGKCDPGYYCGFGESLRAPVTQKAQLGYYAPMGSQFQLACPRGTYSNDVARSACDECDPGYNCPNVAMSTKPSCPKGYYCPALTWFVNQVPAQSYDKLPCPIGTYNPDLGRASVYDCVACTGGKYCDIPALQTFAGVCDAGFFCKSNSPYKRPPVTDGGGKYGPCPVGKYCPQETISPVDCPIGTYSNSIMLTASTECLTCYEGKYCASTGLTAPTDDCTLGYYCAKGQTTSSPGTSSCVAPFYCPPGVGSPLVCPTGFYQNQNIQGTCMDCPKGSYCYQGTQYPCPPGFYCP